MAIGAITKQQCVLDKIQYSASWNGHSNRAGPRPPVLGAFGHAHGGTGQATRSDAR